jgi:hypothetical protein
MNSMIVARGFGGEWSSLATDVLSIKSYRFFGDDLDVDRIGRLNWDA